MISTILGEGGSGGAVALTSGNVILMFEHSIFSVISPEAVHLFYGEMQVRLMKPQKL